MKMKNNTDQEAKISYILNDKIGGISSLNVALAKAGKNISPLKQHFAFYHYQESRDSRFNYTENITDSQSMLEYSKLDNIYYVFKMFEKQLPKGKGALVSNDIFELHYIESFGTDKTVYQIVHDDYNLGLSIKFEPFIDIFIAHSKYIYNKLVSAIPHRVSNCFFCPYGIEIPQNNLRKEYSSPLKLMFLGRMTKDKGIFDLPVIDSHLNKKKIEVKWTIIGRGPEKTNLQEQWRKTNSKVNFISPETKNELNEVIKEQDIFVFPTKFEGFPVSLLETMALGVVPIVSNIPSGIPELVNDNNGYLIEPGNTNYFAKKIEELNNNKGLLLKKSNVCSEQISKHYDLGKNMQVYHKLFKDYLNLKRKGVTLKYHQFGSRLDKWYYPNTLVRFIRKFKYHEKN